MPRCPSCHTPLTRVEEDDIKSLTCVNCFGTWINASALQRRTQLDINQKNETAPASDQSASLQDLAQTVQASNSTGMLRCAECEKPMTKEAFHPMIPVQVDRCRPCGYLWLDAGEFALVRRLYVELLTSTDPEVQRRRDKIGAAAAEWHARRIATTDSQRTVHYEGGDFGNDMFDLLGFLLRSI